MIRVLIVDDSPTVRAVLRAALARESDIEVIGEAPDPYVARELISRQKPDVMTLDMEMPRMDGLTFLRKVMEHLPIPTIVVSSLTARGSELAMQAFEAGAVEVLQKPVGPHQVGALALELSRSVRAAAASKLDRRRTAGPGAPLPSLTSCLDAVLAIGASTGGTVALEAILCRFPSNAPAIVVTQHMPPVFTAAFAQRLTRLCQIEVREAADGDEVMQGLALIAPGGMHLMVRKDGIHRYAEVRAGPKVSGHAPSVDVLFRSVARSVGAASVGVILTGMGRDGARGLREMHDAGATTFSQDEASCVVYGMPHAAEEEGAVDHVVSLTDLPVRLLGHFETPNSRIRSIAARPRALEAP